MGSVVRLRGSLLMTAAEMGFCVMKENNYEPPETGIRFALALEEIMGLFYFSFYKATLLCKLKIVV